MSEPAKPSVGPCVEIDLSALCENYATVQAATAGAEVAAVVKCNAYGLGMEEVAQALATRTDCQTFFVTYPEEGAALRECLMALQSEAKIYVLNGPERENASLFAESQLVPVLNHLEQARAWAENFPSKPVALHIDTGMNRLGAAVSQVDDIAALDGLSIELVMSHLACSSDPANPKNDEQRDLFLDQVKKFPGAKKSLSASGGALMEGDFHFDLVRPGIALYGGSPFDKDDARLKPVATLKAPVIQMRTLKPGETVGYGATLKASKPMTLAVVALGYGDGYHRAGSNHAPVTIHGERATIAGRISMDLIAIDVTDVKTPVNHGDIACFFGKDVTLFEAAAACDTIPYELLTGLGGRVVRRYV